MIKTLTVTLILALSVVLAQGSQFGTHVDENWYDKMELLFQTPTIVPNTYGTDPDYTPLSSGGALVNDRSEASFPSPYEPLRFAAYVGPNADGKGGVLILTNPSIAEIKATGQKIGTVPNSVCYLLGEAAIGERIIRNSVMNLENAVGNEELKNVIVSLGKQDRVYVDLTMPLTPDPNARARNLNLQIRNARTEDALRRVARARRTN
jgi:hypothetical protein